MLFEMLMKTENQYGGKRFCHNVEEKTRGFINHIVSTICDLFMEKSKTIRIETEKQCKAFDSKIRPDFELKEVIKSGNRVSQALG